MLASRRQAGKRCVGLSSEDDAGWRLHTKFVSRKGVGGDERPIFPTRYDLLRQRLIAFAVIREQNVSGLTR
jgi:hypothetical protein